MAGSERLHNHIQDRLLRNPNLLESLESDYVHHKMNHGKQSFINSHLSLYHLRPRIDSHYILHSDKDVSLYINDNLFTKPDLYLVVPRMFSRSNTDNLMSNGNYEVFPFHYYYEVKSSSTPSSFSKGMRQLDKLEYYLDYHDISKNNVSLGLILFNDECTISSGKDKSLRCDITNTSCQEEFLNCLELYKPGDSFDKYKKR